MKVLGIYGSPRKGGNSDLLLEKVLEGAAHAGAQVMEPVLARKLKMNGCIACGGCDETGECVVKDEMQDVYPLLIEADIIFLASPIFFYGMTSQVKRVIDRAQARWNYRRLNKKPGELRSFDSGVGYLVSVGATRGKNLFLGVELVAKYFFDALDMEYGGGLLLHGIEGKGEVKDHPDLLEDAFGFGTRAVKDFGKG